MLFLSEHTGIDSGSCSAAFICHVKLCDSVMCWGSFVGLMCLKEGLFHTLGGSVRSGKRALTKAYIYSLYIYIVHKMVPWFIQRMLLYCSITLKYCEKLYSSGTLLQNSYLRFIRKAIILSVRLWDI